MHTHGYYYVYPVKNYKNLSSVLFLADKMCSYGNNLKTATPLLFPGSTLRQCSPVRYAKGRICRQKASRRSLNS